MARTILVALALVVALPTAAADVGAYVGYDGIVTACVSVSTSGPVSFDPADCEGGTEAVPVQVVGDVAVGARAGTLEVCLLVDENGEVHPSCSPCEFLDEITPLRVDAAIVCGGSVEALALA